MATKRLSRTIVEGGKRGWDKQERREQIQKSRRIARDFCATYCEDGNEIEPIFSDNHYYREFGDRLAALHKFLEAHIGKSWDDIYSKLCAIRSRNTIQGFHFLEHAKGMVFMSTGAGRDIGKFSWGYYIEDGLLQYCEPKKYKRPKKVDKKTRENYENWLGNRRIRSVGTKYFWYNPVIRNKGLFQVTAWPQGKMLNAEEVGHLDWLRVRDYWFWKEILTSM